MSEYELVLDGNDIPEKEFIKKFIGIVDELHEPS